MEGRNLKFLNLPHLNLIRPHFYEAVPKHLRNKDFVRNLESIPQKNSDNLSFIVYRYRSQTINLQMKCFKIFKALTTYTRMFSVLICKFLPKYLLFSRITTFSRFTKFFGRYFIGILQNSVTT